VQERRLDPLSWTLIIFSVESDVDSEIFLVTDFINLKMKLALSFEYVYRDKMYV
jgi:hypothetical protein